MNKKFTKLMAALALLVFMTPSLVGWGQTVGKLTLSSSNKFGTTSGSTLNDDKNNTWTCVGNNIQNSYQTSYSGQQFGTSSTNDVYTFTANLSGKTVTNVAITAAAGNTTPTYDISVGGSSWKSGSLSKTSTSYSGSGSGTGNVVITLDQNNGGKAVYLGSITVTYTSGPVQLSAPTLTATSGNQEVTLTWNAVSDASSYTVMWAGNADFTGGTEVTGVTETSWVKTGLTNGTTYYFKAKSIGDGTNYLSSDYGTAVSATPAIPQLAKPVLTVTEGNTKVTPTWEAVANATSYTLEYADNADFTGATPIANAISGNDIENLTNNTPYYFRLKAIGNGTDYTASAWSETVTATPSTLVTITITQNELANFTNTYNWYNWTVGGISGKAYAFKNSGMQFNKDQLADCFYNTTAIPGTIKSIKMTKASSGTIRSWTVYIASEQITAANSNNQLGDSQNVDTDGTTWVVTDERDCDHFLLSVAGGATVISSIEIKYEPKPTYNVAIDENIQNGTVVATPTSVCENATVTLTATPSENYRFGSFTFTKTSDGTDVTSAITVTGPTDGHYTFAMPAYDITVGATFTRLYTVTVLVDQIENGTVTASPTVAAEGEEITLTAEPAQHYEFSGDDDWLVMYGEESTTVTVTNNKFNMPAADVDVFAYFTQKTYTITYCVNGNSHVIAPAQVPGGDAIGTFPTDPVYGEYSFLGWAQTEGGTDYVPASYKPIANMTLYAVFGTTTTDEETLTITGTTTGIPSSSSGYGDGSLTIGDAQFAYTQIVQQVNGTKYYVQFKKSSGTLYNTNDFGVIHSIVLTYYGTSDKNITVKAGSSANPTSADAISAASVEGNVCTYALPDNCHYILLTNGSVGASQVSSIEIYYETETPVNTTITRISEAQTISSLGENQIIVVENGGVLTFTGANTNPANIIVEDGGQLFVEPSAKSFINVAATIQKSIVARSTENDVNKGWTFIASPIVNETAPTDVINMIPDSDYDYDLYRFNENPTIVDGIGKEWENYKSHNTAPDLFYLLNGYGYLYDNIDEVVLNFVGSINFATEDIIVDLQYTEGVELAGWNLVGNPFTFDAYVNKPFYTLDADGTAIPNAPASGNQVPPCTGIMVHATEEGQSITFSETAFNAPNNGSLQMTVGQQTMERGNVSAVDNAIVSFNEGNELPKFYFMEQNANLYIPQGEKEYAIATSEGQGEMPLNFRANADGQYTLTVNPEGVEMNYLHLIDNMTGNDIDLLQTPSYSFNAKTTDYESRFRLVFAANNENGVSASSTTFAFYSNGNWMVNNEGEATLQVIDVMGRVLSNQTISGTAELNLNQVPGVYVLRLVNGNDVKTQKIVVR